MNKDKRVQQQQKAAALGIKQADGGWAYEQDEVNLVSLSTTPNQACANCRFFVGEGEWCMIVEPWPKQIFTNSWCTEWTPEPSEPMDPIEEMSEAIEELESGMSSLPEPTETKGIIGRFMGIVTGLFSGKSKEDAFASQGIKILEDGQHFLAWWSNNFKDLEDELFPLAALDKFIADTNAGVHQMPELWTYHLPGSKHGQALYLFREGHFAMALGEFDDPATNDLVEPMKKWYESGEPIQMSHGFLYPFDKKQNGQYNEFITFEITTLEPGRAANPFTNFAEVPMNAKDKEFLSKWLKPEQISNLEANAQRAGKLLEESGVEFKTNPAPPSDTKAPEDPALKSMSRHWRRRWTI